MDHKLIRRQEKNKTQVISKDILINGVKTTGFIYGVLIMSLMRFHVETNMINVKKKWVKNYIDV
jgi:hypothetical protein